VNDVISNPHSLLTAHTPAGPSETAGHAGRPQNGSLEANRN